MSLKYVEDVIMIYFGKPFNRKGGTLPKSSKTAEIFIVFLLALHVLLIARREHDLPIVLCKFTAIQ